MCLKSLSRCLRCDLSPCCSGGLTGVQKDNMRAAGWGPFPFPGNPVSALSLGQDPPRLCVPTSTSHTWTSLGCRAEPDWNQLPCRMPLGPKASELNWEQAVGHPIWPAPKGWPPGQAGPTNHRATVALRGGGSMQGHQQALTASMPASQIS